MRDTILKFKKRGNENLFSEMYTISGTVYLKHFVFVVSAYCCVITNDHYDNESSNELHC